MSRLGSAGDRLWRKAKLAKVRIGPSGSNSSLQRENHTAEEKANGKAGTLNKYERYSNGPETLNEQPIRKENDRSGQPGRSSGETEYSEGQDERSRPHVAFFCAAFDRVRHRKDADSFTTTA